MYLSGGITMEDANYYIRLGPYIKKLREKMNMSRAELAEGICSVSYISRIESAQRCPSSIILVQITKKLGVTPEYLFRAIESPSSLEISALISQLTLYIERHDFENIKKLIEDNVHKIKDSSLHDMQLISGLKCYSDAIISKDYKKGINEIEKAIALTYISGNNPTDIEFALMDMKGFFLLLDGYPESSYNHLTDLKKYINKINFIHTKFIVTRFYIHLIISCLDTNNLSECFEYLDYGIDYCKKNNTHNALRELYFLKGELFYRLKRKKDFKIWYDKSILLHKLTKSSNYEYFETFVRNRLELLKNL
jgi:transcriptional regulator with XRE-family HTH domain